MSTELTRRAIRLALATTAVVAAAVLPLSATGAGSAAPEIESLSTLAKYVTGGDVLVEIRLHDDGASAKHLRIERNGEDVSDSFRTMPDGSLRGLVDGLDLGENTIVARANGNGKGTPPGRSATLDVVNHPLSGPLFSGPQQVPFFCETVQNGLGPALDAACSAPTQVRYHYRTTAGAFAALADPTVRPANLAQTTTLDGNTVDYIVRIEKGVIDRSVYEIAALYDPAAAPSPYTSEPGWNERLVYTFGGGCNVGYHQGQGNGGVLTDLFLARGYAVASSTLNVLDNNCSDVISAEVALMVKEHFVETYGPVRHTIGWGGSGGAIQQHLIANNYPGILDGIVPSASFPDAMILDAVSDCRLLMRYFASPAGAGWSAAQRTAASGFGSINHCFAWDVSFASRFNALEACPGAIPVANRYHPVTNPGGIRCTAIEQIANQLGRNPATGFVYSPLDNIGVQYGLNALRAGTITSEQFVSLNENVGGYDVIGVPVAARTVADPIGLERTYSTGRINEAGLGLASTPIIDARTYADAGVDIHTRFWSFVVRQRLLAANGTAGNQAILIANGAGSGAMSVEALTRMEQWLAAIESDGEPGTAAERTLRNRPVELTDACWTSATNRISEPFGLAVAGACETLFPTYGDTRRAAGSGLANDTLKCQRQPLDVASSGFTAAQRARLQTVFPTGVCDWTQPGVGKVAPLGTWLDYR